MTVMFQEEVSKLRLQIVDLSDQVTIQERNARRLSEDLAAEKQKVHDAEEKTRELKNELDALRQEYQRAQRATDKLQTMEQELSEQRDTATTAQLDAGEQKAKVAEVSHKLRIAKGEANDLLAQLTHAKAQIDPLVKLVKALKQREASQLVIRDQLKALDLDRS